MLPQESDDVHKFVAHGDTHRQVLQPLRVGRLLTTRFLFAGALFSSSPASFPCSAAMLDGRYRSHCIVVRRKENCHVVLSCHWLMMLDAFRSLPSAEMDFHQLQSSCKAAAEAGGWGWT